ncbi:MAG: hypothetical protein FDZ69_07520 [Deltaproteobacteria bacterium]|nr:MAG: hypothetical protein FDZ69_07520 [Deltaproteobacteria bacterium]
MSTPPQVFKNRVEAHRYVAGLGIAVAERTFYLDVDRRNMLQPDKSVLLCDVLAYLREKFDYGSQHQRRDISAEEKQREIDDLDLREKRAKVAKLEREQRAEDGKWMLCEEAWAQQAALVGTLRDALRHHFHLGQSSLVHLAGADPARGPELYEGIEEIMARAFNEIMASGRIDVVFEAADEEVAQP